MSTGQLCSFFSSTCRMVLGPRPARGGVNNTSMFSRPFVIGLTSHYILLTAPVTIQVPKHVYLLPGNCRSHGLCPNFPSTLERVWGRLSFRESQLPGLGDAGPPGGVTLYHRAHFSLRSIWFCKGTQCVFSAFNETHRKSQLLGWRGVMRTFGHVILPQKH